ncbi:hypothetical protein PENTCL1PPCAC_11940 [Pristionchus entomophagus]|uniref:EGF-like domain-containing protein n=1 Tax=Pristionchus entomophagus TaxID=358040 RepID=A0AAV5T2R3_9BILA|nr:hypothetical protein PENTCL1PPCAC_11940 [Pristionchus entomophagus]
MRLSWLVLVSTLIVAGLAKWEGSSSTVEPSTSAIPDTTTGEPVDVTDGSTAASSPDGTVPTEADVTEGTPGSTLSPATGETEGPVVTDAPVVTETDDGNTDNTKKPTVGVPTTTTTKAAPITKGSTTTKEPQPDVESFTVHCDKVSELCTYTMQVPGLDIDTYNELILKTNETETDVQDFEGSDLVNLQAGVTKVFDDAQATADYVADQLILIKKEINDLNLQSVSLSNDISSLKTAVANANGNLNKILAKKGSCLYRQCVLKETTTPRPTTTTTIRTTPTPFCKRPENMGVGEDALCKHNGECEPRYDSYYCTCQGNLYGEDGTDCRTSVCDMIKDPQAPGLIFSPGYNGTNNADDDCYGAQWTVKSSDPDNKYLTLVENDADIKGGDYISKLLSSDANLQLTVGKYKLKITKSTKGVQIRQILNYGPTATISYSGSIDDYFHFTIGEVDKNSISN